ncbi:uncharacterized protein At4g13200, chloroplastic [Phalaenopsis equestris]|uniref:uncharacterized protein At4g13200, chloroplastic n=1 Tax=Phalaenopsis equestris TaxID=78828 RepID=UPI0009E497C6|nr:uncharacterized protein At4g13200, chloroplastic [Phalaenopsis equestris]
MIGISSSPFTYSSTPTTDRCHFPAAADRRHSPQALLRLGGDSNRRQRMFRCRSSGGNQTFPSGDNDSKAVLDAFFLGKAFAEALNERLVSAVGEVLGVFGQWQAEQQKQVQDFQEDVVVRAKIAKEKAALEALELQGVISKSLTKTPMGDAPVSPTPNGGLVVENPLSEILKD